MGLSLQATGYEDLRIGYGSFSLLRKDIAKAYSQKHGDLYSVMLQSLLTGLPENFTENWNEGCDDDLDILLWHSDCDGRLTPKECGKIYKSLEKLNVNFENEEYKIFYEKMKNMLLHCYKRRVIMYFV